MILRTLSARYMSAFLRQPHLKTLRVDPLEKVSADFE
jgi:hypothetical protein